MLSQQHLYLGLLFQQEPLLRANGARRILLNSEFRTLKNLTVL